MKKITLCLFLMILVFVGTNSAQSKPKKTTQKKPQTISGIRKVDFKNFTYQVQAFSATGETAKLRNGEFSGDSLNCRLDKVVYGDLTNDGKEEAAVLINCDTGGTAGASEGFVYTMINDRASLLAGFTTEEDDEIGTRSASIKNGLLVVDRFVYGSNDAECCPSYHRSTTYRLNGNNLNKISQSQLKEIQ